MSEKKKLAIFGLSANPPTYLGGHTGIVRHFVRLQLFDLILILPVYRHAYSSKRNLAPFDDRISMSRASFVNEASSVCSVLVEPYERDVYLDYCHRHDDEKSKKVHSVGTIDTIRWLRKQPQFESFEFHLIIGGDTYLDLAVHKKWKGSDELLQLVHIEVIQRIDADQKPILSDTTAIAQNVTFHNVPSLSNVSSSQVRAHFGSLRDLTPSVGTADANCSTMSASAAAPVNLSYVNDTIGGSIKNELHPAVLEYILKHGLYV